jgi:hypothetical protein
MSFIYCKLSVTIFLVSSEIKTREKMKEKGATTSCGFVPLEFMASLASISIQVRVRVRLICLWEQMMLLYL